MNENVEIKVFATPEKFQAYDSQDESRIVEVVRQAVLPREKVEYHSVKVKVKRAEDGSPRYLVAYMLRKDTYTADVVRVDVDANYQVKDFQDEYDNSRDEEEESLDRPTPTFDPAEAFDFIAATPVPEIPTAKLAVEKVHEMAVSAGLKSKMLLGPEATVANYKHYLASGLRGFVNVGHGNTTGIVLDDGTLNHAWFNSLTALQVSPGVVYFNSCKVFNAPLQPAVMKAGARTFIGGIVNLLIGKSEEVCKCFWNKVLAQNQEMKPSLTSCESAHYPTAGAHGISGDFGLFNFISSPLDSYKVVLYGEDDTAGDLAAFIHCYYARNNVMTCEFYKEGSAVPKNRCKGGRVGLAYPWARFSAVLDVLRNEKPVFFGFIFSTKVGYVATEQEPVGEGSDKS